MSASGKKGVMSEAELEQRKLAAQQHTTHRAYAFRDNGEKVLTPAGRSRLVELREFTQDRSKILLIMQEKAADAIMMYELIQGYFVQEVVVKKVPITDVPALRYLPIFFNSMERALRDLLMLMPGDEGVIDAERILSDIYKDGNDTENHE